MKIAKLSLQNLFALNPQPIPQRLGRSLFRAPKAESLFYENVAATALCSLTVVCHPANSERRKGWPEALPIPSGAKIPTKSSTSPDRRQRDAMVATTTRGGDEWVQDIAVTFSGSYVFVFYYILYCTELVRFCQRTNNPGSKGNVGATIPKPHERSCSVCTIFVRHPTDRRFPYHKNPHNASERNHSGL